MTRMSRKLLKSLSAGMVSSMSAFVSGTVVNVAMILGFEAARRMECYIVLPDQDE